LLEEELNPDGQEYKLFPVKLDTSITGLNQFKLGDVYITSF